MAGSGSGVAHQTVVSPTIPLAYWPGGCPSITKVGPPTVILGRSDRQLLSCVNGPQAPGRDAGASDGYVILQGYGMDNEVLDGRDAEIQAELAFLTSPRLHRASRGSVSLVETHRSWLVLDDTHVMKLKKPVRTSWADLSTARSREHNALEELRLNRRLAPEVYRGVLALLELPAGGGFALMPRSLLPPGGARVVDWLVLMRRLPAGRMLDRLIQRGELSEADIDLLAASLAMFYRQTSLSIMGPGAYLHRFDSEQALNRELLTMPRFARLHARPVLDALDAALKLQRSALRERAVRHSLVDGHGDLRPEHVCMLPHRPAVIDALEFSLILRQVDPFDELAFLGMECAVAGAPWAARRLLACFSHAMDDRPADALISFYAAARATLRARQCLAHLVEPGPDQTRRWEPRARRYLACASRSLARVLASSAAPRPSPASRGACHQ